MLDLEDLEAFRTVADAGGVSAAARRIGVSKSIISRRLLRLEQELGVQLLARTTRGAALTEAGTTFREYAARLCAELEHARAAILPRGQLRERLRVAAPVSFGTTHLAPVLAELARRHPLLQVHTSYTDRFVDLVAEGFDVGIRVGYLTDSNLVARRIGAIHGKLVASPSYLAKRGEPATPADLLEHEALLRGTESWRFVRGARSITVRPHGRFKADNGVALAAAAVSGLGLAYLPDFLIQEHLASGALVEVMSDFALPEAGLYLVRPPTPFLPRKIRALTELLVERFG